MAVRGELVAGGGEGLLGLLEVGGRTAERQPAAGQQICILGLEDLLDGDAHREAGLRVECVGCGSNCWTPLATSSLVSIASTSSTVPLPFRRTVAHPDRQQLAIATVAAGGDERDRLDEVALQQLAANLVGDAGAVQ